MAVAVATLRKVATIVLSHIVSPKPSLAMHIAAGLTVLAGIFLSTVKKYRNEAKKFM